MRSAGSTCMSRLAPLVEPTRYSPRVIDENAFGSLAVARTREGPVNCPDA